MSDPAETKGQKEKFVICAPWQVSPGTGVNNVILGLRAAMAESYDSELIVTSWEAPAAAGQHWVPCRAPELPIRNLIGFFLYFFPTAIKLFRLTRGSAAVNAHFPSPSLLPLIALRKLQLVKEVILSVHGSDVTNAGRASWIQQRLYAWMYKRADYVVACSGALAEEVKRLSPKARVVPVWNGVSRPPTNLGARPLKERYLVSVASFTKNKGHSVILRAYERVRAKYPDIKLVLIGGDAPNRAAVEEKIREMGLCEQVKVIVNLPHEEIWNWLGHADCFVHAARKEAFGLAILEAALVRTPVVTSTVGGAREYIIPGVDALTCEPRDDARMAAAILETLDNCAETERRIEAFYKKASDFSWQNAWTKYQLLIQME